MVILLYPYKNPEIIETENRKWAQHVANNWTKNGFKVRGPELLDYTGQQAQYFIENCGEINQKTCHINSEVKNNGRDLHFSEIP
jgi:hypothetical protein